MLQTAKTNSPLWAAHTIMLNPEVPRTEETHSSEHAYPFVSAVGGSLATHGTGQRHRRSGGQSVDCHIHYERCQLY
jgi:hypothetical protein